MAALLATVTGCAQVPIPTAGLPQAERVVEVGGASEFELEVAGPVGLIDLAFTHLGQLQAIAETNGGNRATGTPGHAASLDYVESVLRDAGYDTRRVELAARHPAAGEASVAIVGGGSVGLGPVVPMVGSPEADGITAPLSLTADPVGCTAADYAQARGAVVLVQRGRCSFADKASLAGEAGALAVLVEYEAGAVDLRGDLAGRIDVLPAVGLSHDAGAALRAGMAAGEVVVQVTVAPGHETVPVTNLIAEWPGSGDGAVLMIGAHLDSVPTGPGINDNASGVAVALATAEQLAHEQAAAGLRLAFWDGAELGLLGSTAYLASLTAAERDGIGAYLNLDMLASPHGAIGLSGDGAPLDVLRAALGEAAVKTIDLAGTSDHTPFQAAGIPAAVMHTEGNIQPGLFDDVLTGVAAFDPCHHAQCDTLAAVDTPQIRTRLGLIAEATLTTVRELVG